MSTDAPTEQDHPETSDDFCVDIRWVGAQDKPYYRATFVSESRRGTLAEQPFHGVEVIRPDELARILATLETHGVMLTPGLCESDDLNEYVIEVSLGERELSGSLGDERRSIPILASLREALDDEHRGPLDDVLRRLEGWTDA